ncbi:vicilin-like seed storage protein At2g18540 isoform X2 [Helianthus annuus]|uniref:vicilin-like seed storage protein At2g18540 isoform X2 n=1 Tax=Helianthus annuus TaxID=4232 RepID=UPI000B8FF6E1|nr:vicilin-like seed storage protein At2g18540 isoform X2 [Helianthus annuus]
MANKLQKSDQKFESLSKSLRILCCFWIPINHFNQKSYIWAYLLSFRRSHRRYRNLQISSCVKSDYVASEGRKDPKKCWYFQSLIDYDEYRRLRDGTGLRVGTAWKVKRKRSKRKVAGESKDPAASKVEKKRKKGEEVEPTNPAASKVESMGKQKQKEVKSKSPAASKVESMGKKKQKEVESKNRAASKVESMGKKKQKEVESKNRAASKVERKKNQKLKEGGSKNPAASKIERKRKGKEAESENPAGNTNNVIDVEEDSDNMTLGEFMSKQRALKKKKKQTASEAEEPREPEMTDDEKWDPRTTPCYFYEDPADFPIEKMRKYLRKLTDREVIVP